MDPTLQAEIGQPLFTRFAPERVIALGASQVRSEIVAKMHSKLRIAKPKRATEEISDRIREMVAHGLQYVASTFIPAQEAGAARNPLQALRAILHLCSEKIP